MKKKIIIATIKSWNIENAERFKRKYHGAMIITAPHELTAKIIQKFKPDYIFFPHWSWTIPQDIYEKYNCVIFHMGDLPFGRGGSPLQNLIVRGFKETKISAVKAVKNIDGGPIYMKRKLSLTGTAQAIYERASGIIFNYMIPRMIKATILAQKQRGRAVIFRRRKPKEGNIERLSNINTIYDYIRMLDAEGYPPAFLIRRNFKLEFRRAKIKNDRILAQVEITIKNEK